MWLPPSHPDTKWAFIMGFTIDSFSFFFISNSYPMIIILKYVVDTHVLLMPVMLAENIIVVFLAKLRVKMVTHGIRGILP